jgi:hypothetical protein
MTSFRRALVGLLALVVGGLLFAYAGTRFRATSQSGLPRLPSALQKRWLFVWRDMSDPKEVDRMIARSPALRRMGTTASPSLPTSLQGKPPS